MRPVCYNGQRRMEQSGEKMRMYQLLRKDSGYPKDAVFYLVSVSEFIGIKEFVLLSETGEKKWILGEQELKDKFRRIR